MKYTEDQAGNEALNGVHTMRRALFDSLDAQMGGGVDGVDIRQSLIYIIPTILDPR